MGVIMKVEFNATKTNAEGSKDINNLKNLIRTLAWIFLVISILWFVYALVEREYIVLSMLTYHLLGSFFTAIFSIALFTGSNTIDE